MHAVVLRHTDEKRSKSHLMIGTFVTNIITITCVLSRAVPLRSEVARTRHSHFGLNECWRKGPSGLNYLRRLMDNGSSAVYVRQACPKKEKQNGQSLFALRVISLLLQGPMG